MKKAIAILLVLVMAIGLMAGCGEKGNTEQGNAGATFNGKDLDKDNIKIAYIPISTTGANNVVIQQAADDLVATYDNIKIDFFDCGYDATTQISIVNDCVAQGYDGIVIGCTDEVALAGPLEEAEKAGVVICVINQGTSGVTTGYIESYSYDAGWTVGEMLVEDMGTSGDIILLDCPAAMVATTLHGKGFQDYIAQYPDIKMIDYANIDGFSQENANTAFRDMLTKHDHIDAVYAMADDMAMGVLAAIESAGRQDEGIRVYGSEGMPYACRAVKDGRLTGTVWADNYTSHTVAFSYVLMCIGLGVNTANLGRDATVHLRFPFQKVNAETVDTIIPMLRYE